MTDDAAVDVHVHVHVDVHVIVDVNVDNDVYVNVDVHVDVDVDVIARRRKKDVAEVSSDSYEARGGRNSGVYTVRQSAGRKQRGLSDAECAQSVIHWSKHSHGGRTQVSPRRTLLSTSTTIFSSPGMPTLLFTSVRSVLMRPS